ncbi:hypothetical protein V9T40_001990 [Parthenolecanium corni]|uniref:Uncharacterized protein n=1 Tax=Parthenolecanium corni TaxID=536013 RepID=A0AAN9TFH0_9HEMI
MGENSSPTDISSSLSEFIRKERILKELYKEKKESSTKKVDIDLKYNDEEIDGILQQMGRLLSPAGEELGDKIYKHVIAETENKSIEEILNEARELISEASPLGDNTFICLSTDDLYSCPESDFVLSDGKDFDPSYKHRNNSSSSEEELKTQIENKNKFLRVEDRKNGNCVKPEPTAAKKELFKRPKIKSMLSNDSDDKVQNEIQFLRNEVSRLNQSYEACKNESDSLKDESKKLDRKWRLREKQLLEENEQLKQNVSSIVSTQELDAMKAELKTANETINNLKQNFSKISAEWNKKETKLVEERNQLRYKLQNTPRMAPPNVERLQEQLKDAQEASVKLKLDLDTYKDKCSTLENLCADLKKIIMDEQIADRVYANDNIPASVKQFLSSSSSSVFSTLSHMFGCLSRNASKNRQIYYGQKEIFTTDESSMINDLSKAFDQNGLIPELMKEKEQLRKENMDLNRQVKELEKIVRRRAHPNFSNVSDIIKNYDSKGYEKDSETMINLKKELLEKQHVIIELKNQLVETKANYDQNLLLMQEKIVNIQEESMKMKEELDKKKVIAVNHGPRCKRKGRSCDPPSAASRNFRIELTAKEREIQQLSKQLDEVKRMNKKLMKDKENYYLSSKEQSADDIQLSKKYDNSCFSPGLDRTNCLKNDLSMDENDFNLPNGENNNYELNSDRSCQLNETVENIGTENDCIKIHGTTASEKESNYEQISKKVNFLETEHQNMQQIICDLMKLLTKADAAEKINQNANVDGKIPIEQDEICRFVSALKSIANK